MSPIASLDGTSLFAAFMVGVLGSLHCVGMCGGISAALGQSVCRTGLQRLWFQVLFSSGRVGSYMLAGFIVAALGSGLRDFIGGPAGPVMRVFAGLMMIALGLYIGEWWKGLTRVEAIGTHLWKYLQPIGKTLLPVNTGMQALTLGALWGWLPCGLVYSALSLSIAAADPLTGALGMAAFGLGTVPSMMAVGFASGGVLQAIRTIHVRRVAAVMLIAFGVWTAVFELAGHHHGAHEKPGHAHSQHEHMHHADMQDSNRDHPADHHANMNHGTMPAHEPSTP